MYFQFRDKKQQCRAIQDLMSLQKSLGDHVYAYTQPTDLFWCLVKEYGLSSGERVIIRVALDLWNGEGAVTLSELFKLSYGPRVWILGLMRAASESPEEIDRWLDDQACTQ